MKDLIKDIWQFEQNKPSLVADDLQEHGVSRQTVFETLLRRGVFKWFGVRRLLIKQKETWKARITATQAEIEAAKARGDGYRVAYLRGQMKALTECRQEVRKLCHSDRLQAPDHDTEAVRWLRARVQ